ALWNTFYSQGNHTPQLLETLAFSVGGARKLAAALGVFLHPLGCLEHLDREIQGIPQKLDEIEFERRRCRVAIEVAHEEILPTVTVPSFNKFWIAEDFGNPAYF